MFMPRNMRFGPLNATSIDLCVHDLVAASRYRNSTTILCCENEPLYNAFEIETYSKATDAKKRKKLAFALEQVRTRTPDLIVVQQHLPTAATLAKYTNIPVILHKHNFIRPILGTSFRERLRRLWRLRQFRCLAGTIFVSEACKQAFQRDWPEVQAPVSVVYNGLPFEEWPANSKRSNEIICVSRAAPEKGVRETAQAIAAVLKDEKDWRARFILSEPERFPDYHSSILALLQPISERVEIEYELPFESVKRRYQEGSIAIIASIWDEPFGRSALEAHAAGCAVITSGTGGLSEISAEHAVILPRGFNVDDIVNDLRLLIRDPKKREALALAGRSYCENKFDVRRVSKLADDFYDRILQCDCPIIS
jgi:glycosyltransferase involved in cell wall biosynthesis